MDCDMLAKTGVYSECKTINTGITRFYQQKMLLIRLEVSSATIRSRSSLVFKVLRAWCYSERVMTVTCDLASTQCLHRPFWCDRFMLVKTQLFMFCFQSIATFPWTLSKGKQIEGMQPCALWHAWQNTGLCGSTKDLCKSFQPHPLHHALLNFHLQRLLAMECYGRVGWAVSGQCAQLRSSYNHSNFMDSLVIRSGKSMLVKNGLFFQHS